MSVSIGWQSMFGGAPDALEGVHGPVGRGGGVDLAVGADGHRVDLELLGIEDLLALLALHPEDPAVVARAHVEGAIGGPFNIHRAVHAAGVNLGIEICRQLWRRQRSAAETDA